MRITPEAKECLEWHRNQGHRLVLVSATMLQWLRLWEMHWVWIIPMVVALK